MYQKLMVVDLKKAHELLQSPDYVSEKIHTFANDNSKIIRDDDVIDVANKTKGSILDS